MDLSFENFAQTMTLVMKWVWYNILHLIISNPHINKALIHLLFFTKEDFSYLYFIQVIQNNNWNSNPSLQTPPSKWTTMFFQYSHFLKVERLLFAFGYCVKVKIHSIIFRNRHWFPGAEELMSNFIICLKRNIGLIIMCKWACH